MRVDPGRCLGFRRREGSETRKGTPDDAVREGRGAFYEGCNDVSGEGYACNFPFIVEAALE